MSDRTSISRIAYPNAAFDPLSSTHDNRFAGLYVRAAADVFRFLPMSDRAVAPRIFKPRHRAPLPPAIQALGIEDWQESLHLKFEDEGQSQELSLPVMGNDHAMRFAWSVHILDGKKNHVVTFQRASPLINVFDSTTQDEAALDLRSRPAHIKVVKGEGFAIATYGESYPFLTLIRLVDCSAPVFEAVLEFRDNAVEIHCESSEPFDAHFLVHPVPRRFQKGIAGRPSAAIRPAEIAMIVMGSHSPRVILNLASMPLSFADLPVSRRPLGGRPRSSFPIMPIASRRRTVWPVRNNNQSAELARALDGVLYIGNVHAEQIAEALHEGSFARFVGIVTASAKAALSALPSKWRHGVKLRPGVARYLKHKEKIIGLLVVPDIVASWATVEEFVGEALEKITIPRLPQSVIDPRREQMRWRLPALPFCLDLQVAVTLAVGNRQRGRAMLDGGSEQLDYNLFSNDDLWLVPWQAECVTDRDDLVLEINLRLVTEYLATAVYSDLIEAAVSSSAPQPLDIVVLENTTRHYVELWEHQDLDQLQSVREQLLHAMRLYDAAGTLTLPLLATAFLARCRQRLEVQGCKDQLRRINPLMLVLATGGDEVYDLPLELASAYWASYAASFSNAKPAAAVASFVQQRQMSEPLRRERIIRETVKTMRCADEQHRLSLRMKRQHLGDAVNRILSPASIKLLYAADADRIIACAPVTLDFVPFAGTILGLERPISRIPTGAGLGAAFQIVNAVALASGSGIIGTGRAAILTPLAPRDAAERAAVRFRDELAGVLPYSGFVPQMLAQHAALEDALTLVEACELVIFAGHAWTGVDSSGIDLQRFVLTSKELEKISWTGKLVLLVGCETASVGAGNHDIAETLLQQGARAVVGTTSEVDATQALHFVTTLLRYAINGQPIDYAFFAARRDATIVEALLSTGISWDKAIETAERVSQENATSDFASMAALAGLNWDQAFSAAVFSLSWTLFGGASERLR